MILPIANPVSPRNEDMTETASSGSDVITDKTVSPIMRGDNLSDRDIRSVILMRTCVDASSIRMPEINNITLVGIYP
jgi:hypothetical protein